MAKIFVTNRANKGLEIVAGKYQFIDGVMPASDQDAALLEPILCRFYGCTLEDGDSAEYEKAKDRMDPALLASQTKAAELVGADAPVKAMVAAGKAAGDPNVTGTFSGDQVALKTSDVEGVSTAADNDPDPKNVTNQKIVTPKEAEAEASAKSAKSAASVAKA